MYDFCDGEVFNEHPLFSTDSNALQIIMYYDDVETFRIISWKTQTWWVVWTHVNVSIYDVYSSILLAKIALLTQVYTTSSLCQY